MIWYDNDILQNKELLEDIKNINSNNSFQISNIFNSIINSQKTIMASSSELPNELLQHICLDKHCIQAPFLLIPIQHHLKQLTALVVCLNSSKAKSTDIDKCKKVVLECFR